MQSLNCTQIYIFSSYIHSIRILPENVFCIIVGALSDCATLGFLKSHMSNEWVGSEREHEPLAKLFCPPLTYTIHNTGISDI
ncbi:hypothetical protein GDO78_002805 [Eleutherodactylus coqui]|uniref:Uncharacterized protein n=1 Tax=Eleutherodactylus coqui TaxID=57060 RepID=A0A8J6K1D5_ELECQ|nr:hypothetical protein GDO78_002805 [Eleutherodactylus coqui]